MPSPRLGVALIGCGRVASNHIAAMADNHSDVRLVATCDSVRDKALAMRSRYLELMPELKSEGSSNPVQVTEDFRQVLKDPAVDFVSIATDSGSHAPIALEALEAGKHVLVEKPIALDTRDARRMIEKAESCRLQLGVCFQNRFNPPVQTLRQALDSDEFGRLIYGTVNVRWNRDGRYYKSDAWRGTYAFDGGCLMNQSIHGIDLLLWVFGEPERVYAETDTFLRPIEAEDTAVAVVRFKSGAMGIIEGTTCIYPKNLEETLNVFGTTGSCRLGGIAVNEMEHFVTAQTNGADNLGRMVSQKVDSVYGRGHSPLYKDFVTAIRTSRPPYVDAHAGLRAVEMILAIYKSAATRQPVTFPLGDYSTLEAKEDYTRHGAPQNT